jgi:hypothetical protein
VCATLPLKRMCTTSLRRHNLTSPDPLAPGIAADASSTRTPRMPGLSASELPPAMLFPGDTIEYYSRCFVWGRKEGHRVAVVTRVDSSPEAELPIKVDTGEIIPKDMMMKRVLDRFGVPVGAEVRTWRKLRTYSFVNGTFEAPSRAIALKEALEDAVKASVEALHDLLPRVREEIVPESPLSDCGSPPVSGTRDDTSSTCVFDLTTPPRPTAPTACRQPLCERGIRRKHGWARDN